ncbi:MAG: helix-turn-helix transcriptional regulator [Oscillospiraceae bacterium]|nr:helix-turn-helix transcriptional regulator [Oscillospiraceae bacterium]
MKPEGQVRIPSGCAIAAVISTFVISVGGDSMDPTYHDGDKVFVEKCDSVDVGEVGIFVVNDDVYIKELGNKCLISHNEKYKPIRIGENDSVYCCGRVIGIV